MELEAALQAYIGTVQNLESARARIQVLGYLFSDSRPICQMCYKQTRGCRHSLRLLVEARHLSHAETRFTSSFFNDSRPSHQDIRIGPWAPVPNAYLNHR
jgi:hypothetical protein